MNTWERKKKNKNLKIIFNQEHQNLSRLPKERKGFFVTKISIFMKFLAAHTLMQNIVEKAHILKSDTHEFGF